MKDNINTIFLRSLLYVSWLTSIYTSMFCRNFLKSSRLPVKASGLLSRGSGFGFCLGDGSGVNLVIAFSVLGSGWLLSSRSTLWVARTFVTTSNYMMYQACTRVWYWERYYSRQSLFKVQRRSQRSISQSLVSVTKNVSCKRDIVLVSLRMSLVEKSNQVLATEHDRIYQFIYVRYESKR
jgi:hypothetical protein